jgi:two-component system, chemotaxis family, sensor kinase CheA
MQLDMAKFRDTFFAEAADHLAAIEAILLRLEGSSSDLEAFDEIFRSVHSIKGAAEMFGLAELGRLAHGLESLLDRLRRGEIEFAAELLEQLLQATDLLRDLVRVGKAGAPPPPIDAMLDVLARFGTGASNPPTASLGESRSARDARGDYRIHFAPSRDVFAAGIDPLRLLRDVVDRGEILDCTVDAGALPDLDHLDPEECFLSWSLTLRTERSVDAILNVFAGLDGDSAVSIEPVAVRESDPTRRMAEAVRAPSSQKLFGGYLVDIGLVTVPQVVDALDRQLASQPPFGQVCVREGKLTVETLFEILNSSKLNDMRIGATAVALRHLSGKDVQAILALQRAQRKPLGEILVELGTITALQLQDALVGYKALAAPSQADIGLEARSLATTHVAAGSQPSDDLLENKELIVEFVTEADEHLESAEQHLLALERTPNDRAALDALYRAFHTVKGTSSFFNLRDITKLAHAAEDLLNAARDGTRELTGASFDLAFASVDGLKRQLERLKAAIARGDARFSRDPQVEQLVARFAALTGATASSFKTHPADVITPKLVAVTETETPAPLPARPEGERPDKEIVRVDRDRLDKLINIIGELVIGESMVRQEFAELPIGAVRESRALPQLHMIVRDLQELSLSLRMMPIGGTFQRMARIIRDLGKRLGKQIRFSSLGEETELDKTVVDLIGDPLMHMVRNAADHGIEMPDVRIAAGKPAHGTITLRAFHQSGNIYIEIEDDGKGLDRDAILRKAVERGLVRDGIAIPDSEVYQLIFQPGFSTAKEVTDISGRGVGMDVVRRNVEALQGSISLRSTIGKGSVMTVRLPLTLAILDGLTVSLGDQVFIVPLLSVVESLRPHRSDLKTVAGKGEVVMVRGEVVPLLRLYRVFNMPARATDPSEGLLVLVENDRNKCAILVDELLGQSQVVIKNLEANFRKVDGIASATILGDGRIALILDVDGLTRMTDKRTAPCESKGPNVGTERLAECGNGFRPEGPVRSAQGEALGEQASRVGGPERDVRHVAPVNDPFRADSNERPRSQGSALG